MTSGEPVWVWGIVVEVRPGGVLVVKTDLGPTIVTRVRLPTGTRRFRIRLVPGDRIRVRVPLGGNDEPTATPART